MSITSHAQTFKTLVNFDKTNGADPSVGLVQGRDGNFYGTMYEEGTLGFGTVFRMTPAGKLTTIYNFCSQTSCTDGAYPAPRCSWLPTATFTAPPGTAVPARHCASRAAARFSRSLLRASSQLCTGSTKPTETYRRRN